jgi:hypothetical protein
MSEQQRRVCVIGAGPSGIAAAKNCIAAGFPVVVFEKGDRVGGNWVFDSRTGHSSVYENTHIISSKAWSEYEDFPMPDDYPDYPSHRQLQAYFEAYAKRFGAYERIRFNSTVKRATRDARSGAWTVEYEDERGAARTETFDVLMVANGHHWNPKHPEYPGEFTGTYLHSHDFKGIDDSWRDKSVLVIGGGNSACDVAVESARLAGKVCLSTRSPQWIVPKFIFGMPADVFAARTPGWVPRKVKQFAFGTLLKLLQGSYAAYGLPADLPPPLTQHPTLNSDLLDFIRHGRIHPRPAVAAFAGGEVEFADGRRESFDIVCACTGFWTTFPFFEREFVDFQHAEKIPLYLKMMHAEYDNLYFIGLFQPIGCIWPLADHQAKLACRELLGAYRRPRNMAAAIRHEIEHPHFEFAGGQRHAVEVDYLSFRRELAKSLKAAGVDIGAPPAQRGRRRRPPDRRVGRTADARA